MTAESDFRTTERKPMKTPIEPGRYRLRNGDVVDITSIGKIVAMGTVENTGERMAWDKGNGNGMFDSNPTSWDLVERLPDEPGNSTLTMLRRQHAALMTVADSHAAVSRKALEGAQEIEHRIAEMERSQR